MKPSHAVLAFAAVFMPPAFVFWWMFGGDGLVLYALSAMWVTFSSVRIARGAREDRQKRKAGHG